MAVISPVAMSRCETNNSTIACARRDILFTANTGLREQEREQRHNEGRGNRDTTCVHHRYEDTTLTSRLSARRVTLSQPSRVLRG